jgi:hypothetical protein
MEIHFTAHSEDFQLNVEAILLTLVDLKSQGHQTHLGDRFHRWIWTPGQESIIFDNLWINRR